MKQREFTSIGAFVKHVIGVGLREPIADAAGRAEIAKAMTSTARNMIGNQAFFSPLAQSTVRERLRLGYTPYGTLLRSGDYQRSFGWAHEPSKRATGVGSSSPIAPYHELGGKVPGKPPKRSVLIDPAMKHEVIYFELFAKTYFLVIDA